MNGTVEQIMNAQGESGFQKVDVADYASAQSPVAKAIDIHGKLDVSTSTEELWNTILNVNLRGYFFSCKVSLPELIKTKGNIVIAVSIAGLGVLAGGTVLRPRSSVWLNLSIKWLQNLPAKAYG